MPLSYFYASLAVGAVLILVGTWLTLRVILSARGELDQFVTEHRAEVEAFEQARAAVRPRPTSDGARELTRELPRMINFTPACGRSDDHPAHTFIAYVETHDPQCPEMVRRPCSGHRTMPRRA